MLRPICRSTVSKGSWQQISCLSESVSIENYAASRIQHTLENGLDNGRCTLFEQNQP